MVLSSNVEFSLWHSVLSNMQILQAKDCNITPRLVVFLYAFTHAKLEKGRKKKRHYSVKLKFSSMKRSIALQIIALSAII